MSTTIEWTDEVWNPVTGCTKVSQGCKHCYAERIFARPYPGRKFTDVRCHPERLDAPLHWKKPKRIFVNSVSDLFHEDVPDEFLLQVFDVMRQCQNGWTHRFGGERGHLVTAHTFQILTKRPARMLDFCTRLRFAQNDGRGLYLAKELPHNGFNPMPALSNVWLGVSVEDQGAADERIPLLLQTPAAVRWISAEPLLGPMNIEVHFAVRRVRQDLGRFYAEEGGPDGGMLTGLRWIVAGGESGPKARAPHPDWFRSLRDQCQAARVPFFFKQWGNWAPVGPLYSDDDTEEHLDALDTDPFGLGRWITPAGCEWSEHDGQAPPGTWAMWRKGKKAAGRLLDGREWNDYPDQGNLA